MATVKISLDLPDSLLASARDLVGEQDLSGYVARALRNQLQRDRLSGLLGELEAENGPIDLRIEQEVREAWPRAQQPYCYARAEQPVVSLTS